MDMIARKKMVMMAAKKSRLPSEFQELDCIKTVQQSHAYSCFICTNIVNSNIKSVECKYAIVNYNQSNSNYYPIIIASHAINQLTAVVPYACINTNKSAYITVSPSYDSNLQNILDIFTLTYNTGLYNCLRIGGWSNSYWTAEGAYYYVKVYGTNDELLADFVPCYRKSDDKVGLYDLISQSFYYSNGNYQFIAGNNI